MLCAVLICVYLIVNDVRALPCWDDPLLVQRLPVATWEDQEDIVPFHWTALVCAAGPAVLH